MGSGSGTPPVPSATPQQRHHTTQSPQFEKASRSLVSFSPQPDRSARGVFPQPLSDTRLPFVTHLWFCQLHSPSANDRLIWKCNGVQGTCLALTCLLLPSSAALSCVTAFHRVLSWRLRALCSQCLEAGVLML